MLDELIKWKEELLNSDGVITGCSQEQEWLLPWWWMHYSMHNQFPVAFVDFGNMSREAREFCQKRGQLITLDIPENYITPFDELMEEYKSRWKGKGLELAASRLAWFKKPFACLKSPFKRAIWMDVDCQARLSITPIFKCCENDWQMAIGVEPPIVQQFHEQIGVLCYGELEYNTGVIAFKHGCQTIQKWAKMCLQRNDSFRGDQEVLSRLAFENDFTLPPLEPIHNCRYEMQKDLEAQDIVIYHWLGGSKHDIKEQMAILENACHMSFSLD